MFLTGGPGKPIELGNCIAGAIDEVSHPSRVRIGFAYATEGGISSLCKDEDGNDWRDATSPRWLIGLDQGITEPDALRELAGHSESEVRVLVPGGDLSREALYRRPRFHAKVALIEARTSGAHLVTSSANMTASALADRPTNYEVGLVQSTDEGLTQADIDEFDEWWESAWERSRELTDGFLNEYERIRDDYFENNPDVKEFESSITVNHASEADHLWIETRAMTGGSRNQVEFSEELSPFINDSHGEITVVVDGTTYPDCSVTPRVTDPPYGMNITPVYLPTDYDYQNSYIHFERLSPSSSEKPRYELTIAGPGDDVVDEWRRRARRDGVYSETGGGREYGYY